MALDWGLYGALRSKDDFAQMRQDRAADLQYLQQNRQLENQQLEQQNLAQQGILEYFDQLSKFDVLKEDVERVKNKERELRGSVINGLKESNGDARRFLAAGGMAVMKDYRNNLNNAFEVKQALQNKAAYAQAATDMSKGLVLRPIQTMGPDGKPTMESYSNQLARFQRGEITGLNYQGAVKPIEMNALEFQKYFKDPNNPYRAAKVTANDVYKMAVQKGAEEWHAQQMADQYRKSGETWHWKREIEKPIDAYYRAKTRALAAGKQPMSQWDFLRNGNYIGPSIGQSTDPKTGQPYSLHEQALGLSKDNAFETAGIRSHTNTHNGVTTTTYSILPNRAYNSQYGGINTNDLVGYDTAQGTPHKIKNENIVDIEPTFVYKYYGKDKHGKDIIEPFVRAKVKGVATDKGGSGTSLNERDEPWYKFGFGGDWDGELLIPVNHSAVAASAYDTKQKGMMKNNSYYQTGQTQEQLYNRGADAMNSLGDIMNSPESDEELP